MDIKRLFPKPNLPQKRYILLAVMIIYTVIKVVTYFTPSPDDDHYADDFKGLAATYVCTNNEDAMQT